MDESKKKSFVIKKYPKIIGLWPLMLVSFIFWIVQWTILRDSLVTTPNSVFANIWMWMFFTNLIILAFETGSAKFFGILITMAFILFLMFVFGFPKIPYFNITLFPVFYGFMFIILAIVIGIGILGANFDKWTFEKNEVFGRKGIFSKTRRYPSAGLRYTKEITDIFEYMILRSGSLTIYLSGTDPIILPTVININKICKKLDRLLSQIKVKVVE